MEVQWGEHKVHTYVSEVPSMSSRWNWEPPPPPLPPASVYTHRPPNQRMGEHIRLRVRGWESPNSNEWRKSLALCLLCGG
jgi:hypothetical protein